MLKFSCSRVGILGIVISLLALLLVACGDSTPTQVPAANGSSSTAAASGNATTAAAASGQKVKLVYWTHSHPPMIDLNNQLIKEYQQQNPNVTIEYLNFPGDEYNLKLKTAFATGSGPDVFDVIDSELFSYVVKNQLAPVDPTFFGYKSLQELKNGWLPGSLDGASYKDQVYMVPMEFNTFSLFINTDLYKQAGLDPDKDAPKTWEQLAQNAQKIAALPGQGGQKIEGFKWPVPKLGDLWADVTFEPVLNQYGGSIISKDGKTSTINSPEAIKAIQVYTDFYRKYKTGDSTGGKFDPLNPNEDFAQGTLGNWITGVWAIPTLKGKPVDGKFKVVSLPQDKPDNQATVLYAYGWTVNNSSKIKSEAWKWISFLSSRGEDWLQKVGYIQPRLGWQDSAAAKNTPYLNVFLDDMKRGRYSVRTPQYQEITKSLDNMLTRVMIEGQDPQVSADQAKKEIDAAIAR